MRDEDEREMRRIQAAIAPKLLALVVEEFCGCSGSDKDLWFAEFSSRYLAPMAKLEGQGRYADLSHLAAEDLIQCTVRAMHPNLRPYYAKPTGPG